MDIGKPECIYTVEPIEDPVPQERPEKTDQPDEGQPTPREPEKVPIGA
jgi:hypothetical protein